MRVWTDGAYSGRSDCGGWAWAANLALYGSGAASPTTNNRMELQAVIEALLFFYRHRDPITIISDSQYVVNGVMSGWAVRWRSNGWMRIKGGKNLGPVPNADQWARILNGVSLHRPGVTFEWVRGHSGDRMNDFVDQLAVEQRLALEAEYR